MDVNAATAGAKPAIAIRWIAERSALCAHERVVLAFFTILALLALARPLPPHYKVLLLALPPAIYLACLLETYSPHAWSRIARQWASLSLILLAYWSLQMLSGPRLSQWEARWIAWDRYLLDGLGFRAALESYGRAIPTALESFYLLLYTLPPASLALLYLTGRRHRSRQFLFVLFLGTFAAYLLIPAIPVASPRAAFPGVDLPSFHTLPRSVNVWLLDHLDITTGVFPSGHVAVAFSCAFGLLTAAPRRRLIWCSAFLVAFLVYTATVYGRYHYAVDGLASMLIAAVAWQFASRLNVHAV